MDTTPAPATVVGLGAMGSAIAAALLAAGHPTTVWNRTAARAEPLVARGAVAAPDVASAVAASPLTITSLLDADALRQVAAAAGPALRGRTVVELTSTTPDDAQQVHDLLVAAGARVISGAVLTVPPAIGSDQSLVLYSGDRADFEAHLPTLAALGGRADHVGEAPRAAAVLDMGMLDVFFGSVTAFLHGAALVGADGTSAGRFAPYALAMLELAAVTAEELAVDVDQRAYPGGENSLAMMARGVGHVVEASRTRDLDPGVPELTARLMQRAVDLGHGDDGYGRLIELIRAPQAQSVPLSDSAISSTSPVA